MKQTASYRVFVYWGFPLILIAIVIFLKYRASPMPLVTEDSRRASDQKYHRSIAYGWSPQPWVFSATSPSEEQRMWLEGKGLSPKVYTMSWLDNHCDDWHAWFLSMPQPPVLPVDFGLLDSPDDKAGIATTLHVLNASRIGQITTILRDTRLDLDFRLGLGGTASNMMWFQFDNIRLPGSVDEKVELDGAYFNEMKHLDYDRAVALLWWCTHALTRQYMNNTADDEILGIFLKRGWNLNEYEQRFIRKRI
jgi:hypothetical protein